MGWWEKRDRHRYYVRRRAINGQLVREYLGKGEQATRAAAEDAQKRVAQERERLERKQLEALDTQVAQIDTIITLLSHSHMIDAGWYLHNRGGEWRRRKQYDHSNPAILTKT